MSEITWRMILPLEAPTPVAAAAQAFCTVRRPDAVATGLEVDGVEVDLTRELEDNPALRDAGERVYYLLPLDGKGKADGPFGKDEIPTAAGAPILAMDLLTGDISVTQAL